MQKIHAASAVIHFSPPLYPGSSFEAHAKYPMAGRMKVALWSDPNTEHHLRRMDAIDRHLHYVVSNRYGRISDLEDIITAMLCRAFFHLTAVNRLDPDYVGREMMQIVEWEQMCNIYHPRFSRVANATIPL